MKTINSRGLKNIIFHISTMMEHFNSSLKTKVIIIKVNIIRAATEKVFVINELDNYFSY